MLKVDHGLLQVSHQEGWPCIGHFSLPVAYKLQIPSANGEQAQVAEKSIKHWYSSRKPGTLTKYPVLALLSQPRFAFTERYTLTALLHRRNIFKYKNQVRLLFGPRSSHTSQQNPNPSGDTLPLKLSKWKQYVFLKFIVQVHNFFAYFSLGFFLFWKFYCMFGKWARTT